MSAQTSGAATALRVIEPERGWSFPNLHEVWEYRDLLYFLVRRDVAVRYKQTAVGALWAVLQPLALAVTFSVFLGVLADVPSQGDIPYPLFAFSGMAMWLLFTKALQASADSTVASAELISKVYFPRVIIPLAAIVAPAIDFAFAFVVVVLAMLVYGYPPGVEILLIPFAVLLAMMVAFAGGLWFSAWHVRYRDVQHLVPFLLLVGLFMTPIIYPFELMPEHLQPLYALNPMVGVLELYRWMLFGDLGAPIGVVFVPVVASVVAIVGGALYFKRAERDFVDVI